MELVASAVLVKFSRGEKEKSAINSGSNQHQMERLDNSITELKET